MSALAAFEPAALVLADGTVFHGRSIGARGQSVGEVVFNTSMCGYQEILTDPSYCKQLITLTYPHIGNTGIVDEDFESARIFASGLIIRDLPPVRSNWRSQRGLQEFLVSSGTVGISDIDTRKLTRMIRERGAQGGCIVAGEVDLQVAMEAARGFGGLAGMDLAKEVTTTRSYEWREGEWVLGKGYVVPASSDLHVVAFDYGIKRNILRMLAARGARVTVLPAQSTADEALALKPDGVFLSNGPGDPEPCDYAIRAIKKLLSDTDIPVFGICLGHQLMALASGGSTVKMKFGHHGANHPVKDIDTGKVLISSQNHGFAVDETTLPANLRPTHVSLFDGSLQGLERTDRDAFCFQGHPEASPGPHDIGSLFDRFEAMMRRRISRHA